MTEPTNLMPKDSPTAFAVQVLGVTPHARQAEFLECRAPIRVAACGRRWGKTFAAAIDVLWFALTRPGTVQLVLAPTADQARICWDQARRLAEDSILAGAITHVVESPFPELRLMAPEPAGRGEVESTIMARSASHDGRHTRGHGIDRLIADEAAYIPSPVLSQAVPPMLAASPYHEQVLLSTPFGTSGAFFDHFKMGLDGHPDVRSFQFPTTGNPRVSAEYLIRQRQHMTDLAYRTEYLAEFSADQASVFRPDDITAAIDDSILPGAEQGHRYVIGYDPARWNDRAGCVVLDVTTRPFRAVEVRDIGGREYLRQAEVIRSLAEQYNRASVLLDATSHDQMLEQLRRDGVHAEGYKFTNESKRELIDSLTMAFEQGSIRIPRYDDLLRELAYYRFETTAAGNVKLGAPAGVGMFDDLVTALALAVFAASKQHRIPLVGPAHIPKQDITLHHVLGYREADMGYGNPDSQSIWTRV